MDDNNRHSVRHKVLKAGCILFDDRRTLDCGVKDLSDTGAKLTCENTTLIPDVFRFVLRSDSSMRPAKVVWRKPGSVGVSFTGAAKPAVLRRV
jgi:hypothetical protein